MLNMGGSSEFALPPFAFVILVARGWDGNKTTHLFPEGHKPTTKEVSTQKPKVSANFHLKGEPMW